MIAARCDRVPLVAHVVYRMDTGGMENGIVNIIARMPPERYRHVIVSLTSVGDFAHRIGRDDVRIISLGEQGGHSFSRYLRIWRVLKRLSPAIVHTRNLPTLEAQIPAAFLRGVKRVHGEHGRDLIDLRGTSRKYRLLRKAIHPVVHSYIAVSRDLQSWLTEDIGIPSAQVRQIYNGVAHNVFRGRNGPRPDLAPHGFLTPTSVVVGTVGRLEGVKDQQTLVKAFALLARAGSAHAADLRLVIAGEGSARGRVESVVRECGLDDRVWLAGDRSDIPRILQLLDIFVLPSLAEGVSNTVLEAMATGLPVVATRVGGNLELIREGETGYLVPPGDPRALAGAIFGYLDDPEMRSHHGASARAWVKQRFDWDRCVAEYLEVYDHLLECC